MRVIFLDKKVIIEYKWFDDGLMQITFLVEVDLNNNRTTLAVCFHIVALTMMLILSCRDGSRFNDISQLEKPFGVESAIDSSPPSKFNVFIDASASMYGFTAPNGEFLSIVNSVISRVPQEATIQLYGFGRSSLVLEGDLRQMLHTISDRNFYNQEHTDLCKPFDEHITSDLQSVNLIFTDMVQSTQFADQDRVIFARELKKYLGENGFLSLMAVQADFEGAYYTERVQSNLSVPDGSARPLYCMAFGHRKYADFIQSKLGNLFSNTFEFGTTTENELKCVDNVDYKNEPEGFILDSNNADLPLSQFLLKKGHTDQLKLTMAGYKDGFGKILDYAVAFQSNKDTLFVENPNLGGSVTAEVIPESDKVTFNLPFNNNTPGEYLVRLTFRKTLPKWASDLSTDDDTKIDNIGKTYMLETWMRFIMDNFQDYKHLATTQYYLLIRRK